MRQARAGVAPSGSTTSATFRLIPGSPRSLPTITRLSVIGDYSLYLRNGISVAAAPGRMVIAARNPLALRVGDGRVRLQLDLVGLVIFGFSFGITAGFGSRAKRAA